MIRAKFRCLELTMRWDYTSCIKLAPVTKKKYDHSAGEAMNFAENEKFWKYTPSGECYLHFETMDVSKIPFKIGSYYYIDMEQKDGGTWSLDTAQYYGTDGAGSVEFNRGYVAKPLEGEVKSGLLKIGVSGESAKASSFGPTGKKWDITFSLAHDHTIES